MADSIDGHDLGSYMDRQLSLDSSPLAQTPRRQRPDQMPPPIPIPNGIANGDLFSAAGSPVRSPRGNMPASPQAGSPRRLPGYIPQRDPYNIQGASQQQRKIVDSNGNVEIQTIRKGVEDFEFADELGQGSYSTVVAACDKQTLKQYAIKILDKVHIIKEDKVKYVEIEKNTLNRLGEHAGIIHLYYTFQDRASLFFVLDYAPNGELLHLIKQVGSLDIPCSRYYTAQLLDAVAYMHRNGVVHRDLKPENILLDYKMRIKITDFGTAKLLERNENGTYPSDTRANSFVGTAEYVSPELLSQKYQGKSADVWAIGCILYQMIAGSPPFQGSTQYLTFQRIIQYQYTVPPGFPYLVRDLLKHVLVSTRRRWYIPEIQEHPLFEGIVWDTELLWKNGPPKIRPYRPSSSAMVPPEGMDGVKIGQPRPNQPPSQQQAPQQRVPRPQPSQSQVRQRQMPVPARSMGQQQQVQMQAQQAQQSQLHPQGQAQANANASGQAPLSTGARRIASQPARAGNQSASAAAAALYRRPNATSAGYYAGQERLQALRLQVAEQRPSTERSRTAPPNSRPGGHTAGHAAQPQSSPHSYSASNINNLRESPKVSPRLNQDGFDQEHLPLPPLSALDHAWSALLTNRQERILQLDTAAIGTISSAEGEGDSESKFVKLFTSKKKVRTVMLTTLGRLLIVSDNNKLKGEVQIGTQQVRFRRIERVKGGIMFIVDTYSRTFTLECLQEPELWHKNMELARRYYEQVQAEAERNAKGAAAAAAIAVSGKR